MSLLGQAKARLGVTMISKDVPALEQRSDGIVAAVAAAAVAAAVVVVVAGRRGLAKVTRYCMEQWRRCVPAGGVCRPAVDAV